MSGPESLPGAGGPESAAQTSPPAQDSLGRSHVVVKVRLRGWKRRSRPVTLGDFQRVARLRAQVQDMVDTARAVARKLKGTAAEDCAEQLESLVEYGLDPALTDLTAIEERCALWVAGVSP